MKLNSKIFRSCFKKFINMICKYINFNDIYNNNLFMNLIYLILMEFNLNIFMEDIIKKIFRYKDFMRFLFKIS